MRHTFSLISRNPQSTHNQHPAHLSSEIQHHRSSHRPCPLQFPLVSEERSSNAMLMQDELFFVRIKMRRIDAILRYRQKWLCPPRSRKEQRTTMHMKNRARRPVPASSKFASMLQRAACDKHKSRNALCLSMDADAAAARDEKEGGGAHCNRVAAYPVVSHAHLFVLLAGRHLPEGRSEEAGGLADRLDGGWRFESIEPLIAFVTTEGVQSADLRHGKSMLLKKASSHRVCSLFFRF